MSSSYGMQKSAMVTAQGFNRISGSRHGEVGPGAGGKRAPFLRRRMDEVDYWKKSAGWFDDDVSMKEYNNNIYQANYAGDDASAGADEYAAVGDDAVGGDDLGYGSAESAVSNNDDSGLSLGLLWR